MTLASKIDDVIMQRHSQWGTMSWAERKPHTLKIIKLVLDKSEECLADLAHARIVSVSATQTDRNYFLGHAIGATEDIEAYFDDSKGYGLEMEPVSPVVIPAGYAAKRKGMLAKRADLERQLKEMDAQLKRFSK